MMRKNVLILSDNEFVAKTVELAVRREVETTPVLLDWPAQPAAPLTPTCFDLIVVVLSAYTSEAVVALARASLTDLIGRVPLLIVSDKPFTADAAMRIMHMDFPFTLDGLSEQVRRILQSDDAGIGLHASLTPAASNR